MEYETTVETIVIAKPQTDEVTLSDVAQKEAWAKSLVVATVEDRDEAVKIGKGCKALREQIFGWFAPSKKLAHDAHKAIVAQEKVLIDRLYAIERNIKQAVLKYEQEQERMRMAEQARLQAEADERARKERERLEKAADKLKTPELKEQRLAEAEAVVAPVIEVAPAKQMSGAGTRKTWSASLVDIGALIKAAAEGNDVAKSFLKFDESAARSFAIGTKGQIKVPGVAFEEKQNIAFR